jgi:hypothetical protein
MRKIKTPDGWIQEFDEALGELVWFPFKGHFGIIRNKDDSFQIVDADHNIKDECFESFDEARDAVEALEERWFAYQKDEAAKSKAQSDAIIADWNWRHEQERLNQSNDEGYGTGYPSRGDSHSQSAIGVNGNSGL